MSVLRGMLAGVLGLILAVGGSMGEAKAAAGNGAGSGAAAIQAIQQASDPSAVVSAFANGFAQNRNDPELFSAYVRRMVELGLPTLAYHQAQTLTTLQSQNGLAWAVLAYADARRGAMVEALPSIILAAQFAPNDTFVQTTAGELVAWYDAQADKSQLPANISNGVNGIRNTLSQQNSFASAYQSATKAYQSEAEAPAEQGQSFQPRSTDQTVQTPPLTPGVNVDPGYWGGYYADTGYYYDWGPGWVRPAPWWWWQPVGAWYGYSFVPGFVTVVFTDHSHFRHHHFKGRKFIGHGTHAFHRHGFEGAKNPAWWHRGQHGHHKFFGKPAMASAALAQFEWARFNRLAATGRTLRQNQVDRPNTSVARPLVPLRHNHLGQPNQSVGIMNRGTHRGFASRAAPPIVQRPGIAPSGSSRAVSPAPRVADPGFAGPRMTRPTIPHRFPNGARQGTLIHPSRRGFAPGQSVIRAPSAGPARRVPNVQAPAAGFGQRTPGLRAPAAGFRQAPALQAPSRSFGNLQGRGGMVGGLQGAPGRGR